MQYIDARDAIFQELYKIISADKNAILFTADTGALVFKKYKENIPNQFFNVGISEQNAMGAAAGMALMGKKMFVFGITNFVTLRCLEQIRNDICGMNLPVCIIGLGTGFGYSSDGLTHHITEYIPIMRSLPNMTMFNTSSCRMCAELIHKAYEINGPSFITFDRGPFADPIGDDFNSGVMQDQEDGEIALIATGIGVKKALEVKNKLNRSCKIIDLYRLKPLNVVALLSMIEHCEEIYTIEEHNVLGGLGSIVSEVVAENYKFFNNKFKGMIRFGIPDKFGTHEGSRETQCKLVGFSTEDVVNSINDNAIL